MTSKKYTKRDYLFIDGNGFNFVKIFGNGSIND